MISSLSRVYERTEEMQKRGIFANLFLLQNRLQALFDHDPRNLGVTLKQFLLLVMVRQAACRKPRIRAWARFWAVRGKMSKPWPASWPANSWRCCVRIRAMGAPCACPFRRLPNSILPKAPPSTAKCWIRCLPAIPPKSFCPCIG